MLFNQGKGELDCLLGDGVILYFFQRSISAFIISDGFDLWEMINVSLSDDLSSRHTRPFKIPVLSYPVHLQIHTLPFEGATSIYGHCWHGFGSNHFKFAVLRWAPSLRGFAFRTFGLFTPAVHWGNVPAEAHPLYLQPRDGGGLGAGAGVVRRDVSYLTSKKLRTST